MTKRSFIYTKMYNEYEVIELEQLQKEAEPQKNPHPARGAYLVKTFNKVHNWRGKDVLSIDVEYSKQTFQEITNNRAFGFESFWSSVGGFVGIFLGYSLMQLPELAYRGIANICSRRYCRTSNQIENLNV